MSVVTYVFIVAILLFIFSIYISSMTDVFWLLHFKPIEGVILMLESGYLMQTALLRDR
jgi:uncharacterized membrane protein YgdD (TMEM256/DUF423 family)